MPNEKVIAGLDEAGRGAVIGPLVIVGISFEEDKIKELDKIGVRDSKELSQSRRVKLAEKIEELAKDIVIIKVEACKIDSYRRDGTNLNKLEGIKFADIINLLSPDIAYIDLPENNSEKFGRFIKKMLREEAENCKLILEHKADSRYKVVGAASIIAKVEREKAIDELKKEYGDFGPGYSSNPKTIEWLRKWIKKHKKYPKIVRKSWITAELIKGESEQSKLHGFFERFKRKKEECTD